MIIDNDTASGLGLALNEATLLGAEFDPERRIAATTFAVLTLPDDHSPEPSDPRRQILFTNVGRLVAALRESRWDDLSAVPVVFAVEELLAVVQSFGGQPVYGWEFINLQDRVIDHWEAHPSLAVEASGGSLENRISLFQEGRNRHLDLWIWFQDLLIKDPLGESISLNDFIAGGKRWWDALYAGDARTKDHGIIPGGPANRP